MRIDLKVPYPEKDQAKRLGARWDLARKVWFIEDVEDLTPFMRWMSGRGLGSKVPHAATQQHRQRISRGQPQRTDFSLLDCCAHLAPWEHCEHTLIAEEIEIRAAARLDNHWSNQ